MKIHKIAKGHSQTCGPDFRGRQNAQTLKGGMTQELIQKRTKSPGGVRSLASNPSWYGFALAAILLLSAFLNLYGLTSEGHPNSYYSAAVKNMLTS